MPDGNVPAMESRSSGCLLIPIVIFAEEIPGWVEE